MQKAYGPGRCEERAWVPALLTCLGWPLGPGELGLAWLASGPDVTEPASPLKWAFPFVLFGPILGLILGYFKPATWVMMGLGLGQ